MLNRRRRSIIGSSTGKLDRLSSPTVSEDLGSGAEDVDPAAAAAAAAADQAAAMERAVAEMEEAEEAEEAERGRAAAAEVAAAAAVVRACELAATLLDEGSGRKALCSALSQLSGLGTDALTLKRCFGGCELWAAVRLRAFHADKHVRLYVLRSLRYLVLDADGVRDMLQQGLLLPILVALELDSNSVTLSGRDLFDEVLVRRTVQASEKLQALKLVRHLMDVAPEHLPRGLALTLVAVAEDRSGKDSTFSRATLETLRDMLVCNTELVANAGGVPTVLSAMLEAESDELAESLAFTLLYLINDPEKRKHVRPSLDLQALFSAFTDSDVAVDEQQRSKLSRSRRAIVTMMRSWTGLFFLCSDIYGLRTLVQTLLLPDREQLKLEIFQTLVECLRIVAPNIAPSFGEKEEDSGEGFRDRSSTQVAAGGRYLRRQPRHTNLLDNYAAVLVTALVHCGLLDALQVLGKGTDSRIAKLATEMMGDVMDLADVLLPSDRCLALHRLPALVSDACDFREGVDALARERACIMVTNLQKFGGSRQLSQATVAPLPLATQTNHANAFDRGEGEQATEATLRWLKATVEASMDDETYAKRLKLSRVEDVGYKECEKWEWPVISEIITGPLKSGVRLQQVLKTEFVKSLLSVFLPSKRLLESMRRSPEKIVWVETICALIGVLLASEEGKQHKTFVRLVKEIAQVLESEESGTGEFAGVLESRKFTSFMVREYITIIGNMTRSPAGCAMLEEFNIPTLLIRLCKRSDTRLDVTRHIVSSLDYEKEQSRTVLQLCLTSGPKMVRTAATQHLLYLCRAGAIGFADWGVDSLVTQLNDPDPEVQAMALHILEEACETSDFVHNAVLRNPTQQLAAMSRRSSARGDGKKLTPSTSFVVRQLVTSAAVDPAITEEVAETARLVLLRFLSDEMGFVFLRDTGWLHDEMLAWDAEENVSYVNHVEASLANCLKSSHNAGDASWEGSITAGGNVRVALKSVALPPHLYGQLACTKSGCGLLRGKKEQILRWLAVANGAEESLPVERRAALWLLGHIGSSETGAALLDEIIESPCILDTVAQMACSEPHLSLRGTCLYVFSLMSKHPTHESKAAQLGWTRNESKGVAMPTAEDVFTLPVYDFVGGAMLMHEQGSRMIVDTEAEAERLVDRMSHRDGGEVQLKEKVVALVRLAADMTNQLQLQESRQGLLKLKNDCPELFGDSEILLAIYRLLQSAQLSLQVRRFLQRLFERVDTDTQEFADLLGKNPGFGISEDRFVLTDADWL